VRLRRVVVGALETNCWIVSDGAEALVVDPGDEPDGSAPPPTAST
jgi:hypothetical protein